MLLKPLKYVLAILCLFFAGHLLLQPSSTRVKSKGKAKCQVYQSKSFSSESQNEIPKFRKKYKSKGLQVDIPWINRISFEVFLIGSEISFFSGHEACSSFLYCVSPNRGPPAVIA